MSILKKNKKSHLVKNMFFDEGVDVARYDQVKYPQIDKITEKQMEKTLSEDKRVIDTIYPKYRDGNFITKYDDLVKLYRDDYAKCNTNIYNS